VAGGFPIGIEHVQMAWSPPASGAAASAKDFRGQIDQLLQAARRGEREDVHAQVIEAAERILFPRAFELAGGNQAKAARWLGVARQTVREKLARFGHDFGGDAPGTELTRDFKD
jgi:DNA-binding protein Fis